MAEPTTTTYALLGLLAVKSWTGYELTQQARRSLRYAWPSSEANLYREQQRLVRLGWASVVAEPIGDRTRKRYTITDGGRDALHAWLETTPEGPRLEIEGIIRVFFADHGSVDALRRSLEATATQTREALEPMTEMMEDYLVTGGPFPERAHLTALVADLITDLLARIERFSSDVADELAKRGSLDVNAWTDETRSRLEAAHARCAAAELPGPRGYKATEAG